MGQWNKHPDDDDNAEAADENEEESDQDFELIVFPIDYKKMSQRFGHYLKKNKSTVENQTELLKYRNLFHDKYVRESSENETVVDDVLSSVEQELNELANEQSEKMAKKKQKKNKKKKNSSAATATTTTITEAATTSTTEQPANETKAQKTIRNNTKVTKTTKT